MILLTLLACFGGGDTASAPTGPPAVWIDTDPAVGVPERDVDDGVALLQALRSPEMQIRGVSTVFGNAPLDQAHPIARRLLDTWEADVPLHRGAAQADRAPTDASRALAAALDAEPLTLLVLGPATNVATVLTNRPELAERITEVVAVAGRRPGQRFTTGTTNDRGHRDFNFEQDPEAFGVLLDAGVPLTLAGFEVSSKVWVDAGRLARWANEPASAVLAEPAEGWLELWTREFGVDGFNPFDTLAVGYLVRPNLLTCAPGLARIEIGPDDRTAAAMQGTDVATKPYLHVRPADASEGGAPVTWCHDVEAEPFLADLDLRLLVGD